MSTDAAPVGTVEEIRRLLLPRRRSRPAAGTPTFRWRHDGTVGGNFPGHRVSRSRSGRWFLESDALERSGNSRSGIHRGLFGKWDLIRRLFGTVCL